MGLPLQTSCERARLEIMFLGEAAGWLPGAWQSRAVPDIEEDSLGPVDLEAADRD